MPAPDALVLKAELAEDLERNTAMKAYLQHYIDSTQGRLPARPGNPLPNSMFKPTDTAETVAATYLRHLGLAEAFYVAPSLLDLVQGAAISMPDEVLLPQDLPADTGFMWVPGGFSTFDVRGQRMVYNAITWHRHGDGVDVGLWSDKHDPVDAVAAAMRRHGTWATTPRLTLADQHGLRFGHDLPHALTLAADVPPQIADYITFNLAQASDDPDGHGSPDSQTLTWTWTGPRPLAEALHDLDMTLDDLRDLFQPRPGPNPALRCLLATWRLMQQTITTVEDEEVPRQIRRRLERMNVPDRKVSVVGLRKRPSRGDGTSDVEWSHRWCVRGHWRRQPYKDPETGGVVYRQIYINPFLKGPEGAPLLVRDHVYALVR